jgi:hypothetical protein
MIQANRNTILLSLAVALGVMLVAGLIAIPAMEQAFADNGNHFGKIRNGNNGQHNGNGGINTS